MIEVVFFNSNGYITGFHLTGHAGFADEGSDIVCASVSSAAYMTANTLTEILHLTPTLSVDDADMLLKFTDFADITKAADIINGFRLHITELQSQYPRYITVNISEV